MLVLRPFLLNSTRPFNRFMNQTMKPIFSLVVATALCSPCFGAEVSLPSATSRPVVVEVGPHHRVWQTLTVDDQGRTNTSSYTELATGLNYLNPATGQW